jgi:hypothetical protein
VPHRRGVRSQAHPARIQWICFPGGSLIQKIGAVAARKCGGLVADMVQVARDYRVLRQGTAHPPEYGRDADFRSRNLTQASDSLLVKTLLRDCGGVVAAPAGRFPMAPLLAPREPEGAEKTAVVGIGDIGPLIRDELKICRSSPRV